ncbi:larval cuticle protein A2B [Diachasma alloeum]|uniref:larval cuticle protein A2B n=1 Tax=Diachasma alloeum TaxID=454923 RepID=UPI0007384B3F|nr:larval cuticle protein A2B [Diachasma alloeum]
MFVKAVILSALVAVATAGFLPAAPAAVAYQQAHAPVIYHSAPQPVAYHAAPVPVAYGHPAPVSVQRTINPEDDPHPQYSYAYDVQDATTGDFKNQQESRDGDTVHGSYSLLEADGTRRIVEYTADPINGFNAVVHKEPAQVAVNAVHAAPVVHAAPAYIHHH